MYSRGHVWNDNGTIVQRRNANNRLCLYEAEGLRKLIANIEELVGMPVDRIIVEGKRKASLQYLRDAFPDFKLKMARMLRSRVYGSLSDMGAVFGFGRYELLDFRRKEHVKVFGRNIYCLPLLCGDLIATFNLVEEKQAKLDIADKDGGYEITVRAGGEYDEETSRRLQKSVIVPRPGDYELEGCPGCGVPQALKEYKWDQGEGVMTDTVTGRHMAFLGPEEIEIILRELEVELGEDIPRTIVEAQRQYVIEALGQSEFEKSPGYLRRQLAMRGLGNLVDLDLANERLDVVVENASPSLLVAGIMQGIYELITGNTSSYDLDRDGDGTLRMTVTRAS